MTQRKPTVPDTHDDDGADWDDLLERTPGFDWRPHISIDRDIAFGKPAVTGTRLAVEFILELFALGWHEETIIDSYPGLRRESLCAVFAYAADLARERQQRPVWMTDASPTTEPGPRAKRLPGYPVPPGARSPGLSDRSRLTTG